MYIDINIYTYIHSYIVYIHIIYVYIYILVSFLRVPKKCPPVPRFKLFPTNISSLLRPSLRAPTERCTNWSKFTDTTSVPSGEVEFNKGVVGPTFRFQGVGHQISPTRWVFFPKNREIEIPQNGWWKEWKTPMKMDDLGKHPYFLKTI